MAFELFKNAMRATVEYHGKDSEKFPPIVVTISHGPSELSIKVRTLLNAEGDCTYPSKRFLATKTQKGNLKSVSHLWGQLCELFSSGPQGF